MTELKLKSWQCFYVAMQFHVNVPKKCRYTLPLYLVNEKKCPLVEYSSFNSGIYLVVHMEKYVIPPILSLDFKLAAISLVSGEINFQATKLRRAKAVCVATFMIKITQPYPRKSCPYEH